MNDRFKVAVFDSGIGGINILRACVEAFPYVDFIYCADNYHVPYGAMDACELHRRVKSVFDGIASVSPTCAIVACNTVTGGCIRDLRAGYPFPLIGVEPAIKPAAAEGGNCLVLATETTVASPNVLRLVSKYGGGRVELAPCHNLASYIERNIFDIKEEELYALLPCKKPDTVVLGCTHYIYVKREIEKFYGCKSFDGVDGIVAALRKTLQKCGDFDAKTLGKVSFWGGDTAKNERVFISGKKSQNFPLFFQK